MAWLLTGNYNIAGGSAAVSLFLSSTIANQILVFVLLTPARVRGNLRFYGWGHPESTHPLDCADAIGVASVPSSLGKIDFTKGSCSSEAPTMEAGAQHGKNLSQTPHGVANTF
jgi:hypothetical protein